MNMIDYLKLQLQLESNYRELKLRLENQKDIRLAELQNEIRKMELEVESKRIELESNKTILESNKTILESKKIDLEILKINQTKKTKK